MDSPQSCATSTREVGWARPADRKYHLSLSARWTNHAAQRARTSDRLEDPRTGFYEKTLTARATTRAMITSESDRLHRHE